MITKKTKLLSALVAVVMLISMCAIFAMPAVAATEDLTEDLTEDQAKALPRASTATTAATADSAYQIADIKDLNYVAAHSQYFWNGVLYITENITVSTDDAANDLGGEMGKDNTTGTNNYGVQAAINGLGHTISGINHTSSYGWLDLYKGAYVKNIRFYDCSFTDKDKDAFGAIVGRASYNGFYMENIEMEECSVTRTTGAKKLALLVGYTQFSANATLAFRNISIVDCELAVGTETDYHANDGAAFILGGCSGTVPATVIDGLYMDGNTISGKYNYIEANDSVGLLVGRSMNAGDTSAVELTVRNALVKNTTVASETMAGGIVIGGSGNTSEKFVIDNMIAYNNNLTVNNGGYLLFTRTSGGTQPTITTVATDVSAIHRDAGLTGAANTTTLDDIVTTGAAVYNVNANNGTGTDWAIVVGETNEVVEADETNTAVGRVSFVTPNGTVYRYTDSTGALLTSAPALTGSSWQVNDADVTLPLTFKDGAVYKDSAVAVDVSALQEAYVYWNGKDAQYFAAADLANNIARANAILNEDASTDAEEVATLAAALNAAKAQGYAADVTKLPAAALYSTYPDAPGYQITGVPDAEAIAATPTNYGATKTLYLAVKELDLTNSTAAARLGSAAKFDGRGNTIKGINVTNMNAGGWFADGITSVKNVTFDGCAGDEAKANDALLVKSPTAALTFENVKIINSTITYTDTAVDTQGMAFFVGNSTQKLTFTDILVEGCTIDLAAGKGKMVGFLAGSNSGGGDYTNITIIGNTINGESREVKRNALMVGNAWGGTHNVKNVLIANNTIEKGTEDAVRSTLFGWAYAYNASFTYNIENVIAYNNGTADLIHSTSRSGTNTGTVTISNVYADVANVAGSVGAGTTINSTANLDAAAAISSGEAAYALNAAYAKDNTATKWAVKNGEIVKVADGVAAPVKVTFVAGGTTYVLYTDANGDLIDAPAAVTAVTQWYQDGVAVELPDTYTNGSVYVDSTVDVGNLQTAYNFFNGKNYSYYADAELATKMTTAAAILGAPTSYSQNEINAAAADLTNAKVAGYKATAYIPATEYETYPDASRYAVGSVEDINAVSNHASAFTADKLIFITANIDLEGATIASWNGVHARIDGQGNTIENAKVNVAGNDGAGAWLGSYNGSYFGNITLKGWESTGTAGTNTALVFGMPTSTDLLIEKLTMDDCSMSSGEAVWGLIVGRAQAGVNTAGKTITFKDITVVNSSLLPTAKSNDGVGFLIGGYTSTEGKVHNTVVENLYMDNNDITGTTATEAYHQGIGIVIGRPNDTAVAVDLSINNAVVKNTTISENVMRGALVGSYGTGGLDVVLNNVIAYNNDVDTLVMGREKNTLTSCSNIFADTIYLITGYNDETGELSGPTTNANKDAAVVAIASGEAVYTLNKATATDATKWVVKSGEVVKVADGESLPVKASFFPADGEEFVLYTGVDGKLTGENAATVYATTWKINGEGEELTFTADSSDYVDGAAYYEPGASLDTSALEEAYAYFDGKDPKYFADADLATKMATAKAILDGTAEEITVDSIAAAAAALVAAKAAGYAADAKIPVGEKDTYSDAMNFAVASKDDYLLVSGDTSFYSQGKTIYFTVDELDLAGVTATWAGVQANVDGQGVIITNLSIAENWLGEDYKASYIKNLTFKDCAATAIGQEDAFLFRYAANNTAEGMLIENITFDNVEVTVAPATDKFYQRSVMIAVCKGLTTMKNITIKNSTLNALKNNESVALLLAKVAEGKSLTIDGLYLYNNDITGMGNASVGYVCGQVQGTLDMKNVVLVDNACSDSRVTLYGYGAATATATNVIAYNNGTASLDKGDSTSVLAFEGTDLGELVYNANAAIAESTETGLLTWAIKAGEVVAAGEGVAAPVKVTVTLNYTNPNLTTETMTLYTDYQGNVLGADAVASKLGLANDWSADLTDTFAVDTVVTGTHTCVGSSEWTTKNGVHSKTCTNEACGAVFESGNCDYDYTVPETPKPGTQHTKTCKICNDKINEDCDYAQDPSHKDAFVGDCENGSVAVWVCAGCNATYKIVGTVPGHTTDMTHVGEVAESYHTYVCQNENCSDEDNTWTEFCTEDDFEVAITPANCYNGGTITYTCKVCAEKGVNTVFTVDDPNASQRAHDFGAWYVYKEVSSDEDGEMRHDCQYPDCEGYESKPISKDSPRLVVVGGDVFPGETVDVEINVAKIPEEGLSGLTVEVTFDKNVLVLKEIKPANGSDFFVTNKKDGENNEVIDLSAVDGKIKISGGTAGTLVGDGDIFVLTFEAKDGAAVGSYAVTATATDITNNDAVDPEYVLLDGSGDVEVVDYQVGDVNKDGKISIADAVCLARYHAGVEGYTNFDLKTMDCDGNGELETADVTYLMWYLNGWVKTLG